MSYLLLDIYILLDIVNIINITVDYNNLSCNMLLSDIVTQKRSKNERENYEKFNHNL